MSAVSMAAAAPVPSTAIAAFLRGVGRRAVVFAELQTGDAARADAAVVAAAAGFRDQAPGLELAHWPRLFWAGLVNTPALRGATPAASDWAAIPPGPRAALLLRLAAGLGEDEAACVLGIGVPAYRLALQRALPVPGGTDPFASLQAQLQQRLAAVRAERLACVMDETAALSGGETNSTATGIRPSAPRGLLAVLWVLLALCVGAFAATYLWPSERDAVAVVDARGEALPPADTPAARYHDDAGQIVHRDFALLVDANAAPFVRDLEFFSWLAAQAGGDADAQLALAPGADPVAVPLDAATEAGLETDDAPL